MATIDMREHFQVDDLVEILVNYNKGKVGRVQLVTPDECWVDDCGPYSSPTSLRVIERGGKTVGEAFAREPKLSKQCHTEGPKTNFNSAARWICTRTKGHDGQCASVAEGGGHNCDPWWGANPDPNAGKTLPAPPPSFFGEAAQAVVDSAAELSKELASKQAECLRLERIATEAQNERDLARQALRNADAARILAEDEVLRLKGEIKRMKGAGW